MEKAFAYICASEEAAPRLLKRYCRKVYELGYIPICPRLSDGQYLALESPDEKRTFYSIARQKLGRCRMLVVCGNEISTAMTAEIGQAEKRNLICTTLDGLAKNQGAGRIKAALDDAVFYWYNINKETRKICYTYFIVFVIK